MTFEISKYALMDRVREKKEIEDAIAAANSEGGGVTTLAVTTGASPNILTNITAGVIEVTTGGTAGDEFLGIKKYDVGSDAAIENVGKIIRVKVVTRTNVSDVPRLLQIETVGSNTQLFCILPDETVVAELVDTDAGVALSTSPDEFLTLIWGGAKWYVDLSRSPGFNSSDFTFYAPSGVVTPPTFSKTGNWLYDVPLAAVSPASVGIIGGSFATPAGKWVQSFIYNEYTFPGGLSALSSSDLEGVLGISDIASKTIALLAFPALKFVGGEFSIRLATALTALDLTALSYVGGDFAITEAILTGINLSSLKRVEGTFQIFTLPNLTSLDISSLQSIGSAFLPDTLASIQTINASALIHCGAFTPKNMAALTSLSVTALVRIGGAVAPQNCAALTSLTFPALVYLNDEISMITGLDSLTTFTLGSGLKRVDGDVAITDPPLNQASVDSVLVRLAALNGTGGTTTYNGHDVDVSGNCAAPSATGLTAKATLEGRGNTVTVN